MRATLSTPLWPAVLLYFLLLLIPIAVLYVGWRYWRHTRSTRAYRRWRRCVALVGGSGGAEAGDRGVGKTTLFWRLCYGRAPRYPTLPSQEANQAPMKTPSAAGSALTVLDVPGHARLETERQRYLWSGRGVPEVLVLVVDASRPHVHSDVTFALDTLRLDALLAAGVACAVFANKSDVATAMPLKVLQARFVNECTRVLQSRQGTGDGQTPAVDVHRLPFLSGSALSGVGVDALRQWIAGATAPR